MLSRGFGGSHFMAILLGTLRALQETEQAAFHWLCGWEMRKQVYSRSSVGQVMGVKTWFWLGTKVPDGALGQAQQQYESYFNLLLNFCCLGKQLTFQMAALKNREGHPGVQYSGYSLFTSDWGGQAMKILLIPEIQNIETLPICLLWSEGQEGTGLFSLLALWISAFAPFYFSGPLNDQNRHS